MPCPHKVVSRIFRKMVCRASSLRYISFCASTLRSIRTKKRLKERISQTLCNKNTFIA